MNQVAFLVWLAVIAVSSQLIAVFVMWQLQRLNNLEVVRLQRRDVLSREERALLVEEDARIAAEVTVEAMRGTIRDEVRRALEEVGRG